MASYFIISKEKQMDKKSKKVPDDQGKKNIIYGNPEYEASEDIYAKGEKIVDTEEEIVPDKLKSLAEDLDIPGSELDDTDEAIGEEDEENNYYSLGGDNHNDLEEDKSE